MILIRKAERYGEFDKTPGSPRPFKVGDTVRISEGFFSGYHALVQEFVAKMKMVRATREARPRVLSAFLIRHYGARNRIFSAGD